MKKTLVELFTGKPGPLSLWELNVWCDYRRKFGFSTDRIEAVGATGASAICHAWGAKVSPEDIIPKWGDGIPSKRKLVLQLSSLPGASVEFVPNDPNKPVLTGRAALEALDIDDGGDRPAERRTLDGTPPRRQHRGRNTLAGD